MGEMGSIGGLGLWGTLLALAFSLVASPAVAAALPKPECAIPPGYPDSRPGETSDLYGEVRVLDPYRWLEADVRTAPDVRGWIDAQNRVTRHYLDRIPQRAAIRARMEALSSIESESLPRFAGILQIYLRRGAGEERYSLWVRAGDDGAPRKLVDPVQASASGSAALAAFVPERSGRHVAFAIQEAGSDWRTWYVLDIASGKVLNDRVRWNKFSSVVWKPDGKGFYYTRFPEPRPNELYRAANAEVSLYYHRLGTTQSRDRLIYRNEDQPDHLFTASMAENRLLISSGYQGGGPTVLGQTDEGKGFESLFPPTHNPLLSYRFVSADGDSLYFLSNEGAPNGRLISLDMRNLAKGASTVIAEADATLSSVTRIGGLFVANYLEDAKSRIRIFDAKGNDLGGVPLSGFGSVEGFSRGPDNHSVYFKFATFGMPPALYRYDLKTRRIALVRAPSAPVSSDDYRAEQVFFTARDGKRIPMFLAFRKGLVRDGENPVLLYGYGGFGLSFPPNFNPEQVAWMDMGGIFAFPALPGGGEYGEAWHRAGQFENKPAVFDAFVDAARYLIDRGYTRPQRLAIFGHSNGGLLVGAAMTRRPDLFAVALPTVGVLDMLRFPKFTNGALWSIEFGSPDDPKMFPVLRGYSPYHNIVPGQSYPATLITTGDTDDRVYPAHSYKFAARLQAEEASGTPFLLHVEANAGHGAGARRSQVVDSAADRLAFTACNLGMSLPPTFAGDSDRVPTD